MKPGSAIGVSMTRVRAEFLDKAGKNLEGRAGLGHVLADDEDGLVAAHFLGERLVDGLGQGDFTHGVSPQAA
jgi:methyl coenzyme M reductase gamma subunit